MNDASEILMNIFSIERMISLMRAGVILVLGLLLAKIVSSGLVRLLGRYTSPQQATLFRRISFHFFVILVVVSAMRELGFELGVFLGAAGILTLALGFASQTSVSNLISGLFLIGERPFVAGDVIKLGDTTGEVLSIDLLSIKLRTFDNLLVRIPNETAIKSQITNMTHFPIRRVDLQVAVAYKEDISKVRSVLLEVADRNPLCLQEPKPLFIFLGFGDSSLNLQFSVWAKRENFLALRNSIQEEIKTAFDSQGIEIPFPHRTLYAGSITEPFPVRVVEASPPKSYR